MPQPMIIKRFETKTIVEPGERWVIARISTTIVDRDGDVVLPSGLDLKDFNANPVVMFGHGDFKLPVGQAPDIRKRPNDIVAKVIFAQRPVSHPDSQEWVPDTLHELFKQGVLRAFSAGFSVLPGGSRPATQKDRDRFGDGLLRVITKWALVELSIVPIPANQEALAVAVSKGWMPRDSWIRARLGTSADALDIVGDDDQDSLVLGDGEPPELVIG